MKTTQKLFALWIAVIITVSVHAQSFDAITNALRSGNASALAAHFNTNVEVTLKNNEASYSKGQAEMIIRNFFATNNVRSFSIAHQGNSPEGSRYIIGNMVTSGGNYRVYVYARTVGNGLGIQEIRIENQ